MLDLPADVWRRLRSETDHELRAALVCLLTAAVAAQGKAAVVGERTGGWFWLPPRSLWQPWATAGLTASFVRWRCKPATSTCRAAQPVSPSVPHELPPRQVPDFTRRLRRALRARISHGLMDPPKRALTLEHEDLIDATLMLAWLAGGWYCFYS